MSVSFKTFHQGENNVEGIIRSLKIFYGIWQLPRAGYNKFISFLRFKGLIRFNKDSNLYISKALIVSIFVDNMLLFAKDNKTILKVKK
jgi:hypothetical protein